MFFKIGALKNFCFHVKFAKYLRTPFFTVHLQWVLLLNVPLIGCNIFTQLMVTLIVTVLALRIWDHLPKNLKAKSYFQLFERFLSDWFGPKCYCYYLESLIFHLIDPHLVFYWKFFAFIFYLFIVFYPGMIFDENE